MALEMMEEMLFRFRLIWIAGRFGGGKTSLGVHIATRFVQQGLATRIVTNTPLKWGRLVGTVAHEDVMDVTGAVFLLDEAWRIMAKGKRGEDKLDQWLAYLRKFNQFVIMASVRTVHKEVKFFRCVRRFNGLPFGFPFWWYKWNLDTGIGLEKGNYIWWNPVKVFDLYHHELPEMEDFGVYETNQNVGGYQSGVGEPSAKHGVSWSKSYQYNGEQKKLGGDSGGVDSGRLSLVRGQNPLL